ncbi:hypothetical protein [Pseudolysinimonas sp.]|uniref:hypothetical protein n=1 Tax=Pseudolysinimonas sp. TaxID=2680009 RepID=UPI003F7DAE5B
MNMHRNVLGHGRGDDCLRHHGGYRRHPLERVVVPAALGWVLGFSSGAIVGLIGALDILAVSGAARRGRGAEVADDDGPVSL